MMWLLEGVQDCPWLDFYPSTKFWAYFPEPYHQVLVLDSSETLIRFLEARSEKNTALKMLDFQVETGVVSQVSGSFFPLQCERVEYSASP
jgi:hypothetical protein